MSNNELIIFKTHLLDLHIINEYIKMRRYNYNCILFIDNYKNIFPDHGYKIGKCKLFNKDILYFLNNKEDYIGLSLPMLGMNTNPSHTEIMWHNCDYPLYVVRKYFPEFEYYWSVEYDCYMNGSDYSVFFEKFFNHYEDFLVTGYFKPKHGEWSMMEKTDWIYQHTEIYGCILPLLRISGSAIDFLYTKRLDHKIIFYDAIKQSDNIANIRWINSEPFMATELTNNNYVCKKIDTERIAFRPFFSEPFYKEKLYLKPDNLIYHPIKNHDFIKELNITT